MKIFITGGSGFIGQPLLKRLREHELLVLGRQPLPELPEGSQHLVGNLMNRKDWKPALNNFAPDAAIHLAWDGLPDYSLSRCMENFNATLHLWETLAEVGCRKIISAGTCWEYGELQGKLAEDANPTKTNLFASFKSALRKIGESLAADNENEIEFVWGRIFFAYGPGQRETSLIPQCIQAFREGRRPEVRTPTAINDFIHVDDVASALTALVETSGVHGTFNIGSGRPVQVGELVQSLEKLIENNSEGLPPPMDESSKKAEAGKGFWANPEKIKDATGWEASISLEAGLKQV